MISWGRTRPKLKWLEAKLGGSRGQKVIWWAKGRVKAKANMEPGKT